MQTSKNFYMLCNLVVIFFISIFICTKSDAQTNSGDTTGGWQFSWSDEFNGPNVDPATWGYEIGYIRNNELQFYTNRTENSRIDSSNLLIEALRDNWNGHEYTSASRTTYGKKSFLYGKFEMRAKIDIRQGSWPAWWWLPNSGGWPKGGEIDMMEYYQNKCLFNVMDGNQKWYSQTRSIFTLGGARWAANFHVWTMVWDSTKIDLYLDDNLINHFLLSNADGTGPNGANPFRRPGYMIVNQAIGGTNGGDPSKTTFPVDYRIDWIRVYKWNDSTSYTLKVNNGTGTGPYIPGTKASISAFMAASGMVFDKWVVTSGNPVIADSLSPSTYVTMPSADAAITATYTASTSVNSDRSLGGYNFELLQNYPNPFNPATIIKYSVPVPGLVRIKVYNVLGIEVASLQNGFKSAGTYEIHYNASGLPSGVYFYSIYDGNYFETKKMMLLK